MHNMYQNYLSWWQIRKCFLETTIFITKRLKEIKDLEFMGERVLLEIQADHQTIFADKEYQGDIEMF